MIEEHQLIRIKKTKFVEMSYDIDNRELMVIVYNQSMGDIAKMDSTVAVIIPINKIPQVIRGLFSCYQRFHRRK